MSTPRLSICIPTHHGRGEFLREALSSILGQIASLPPGIVSISISDNASQDATEAIVRELSTAYPGILAYHRNEVNLGFTPNLLRAIAGANGDYCWIFSSDDCISPDGLRQVLEALERHSGTAGMTVNFATYDSRMEHPKPIKMDIGLPEHPFQEQTFTSVSETLRQCSSVLGYVSGQIVHRELWQQAVDEVGEQTLRTVGYFPYAYLIAQMLQKRPLWVWNPEPLVYNRLDNDSVTQDLGKNLIRYVLGNLHGLEIIWATFLGQRSELYHFLMKDSYKRYWTWRQIISCKAHTRSGWGDNVRLLIEFTRRFYFIPSFWLMTFPCLLIPHPVFRAAALRGG
jgi:glycosyltransferase involved in cell wall biosynthesis